MGYIVIVTADDMDAVKNILRMNHPDDGTKHVIAGVWKVPDPNAPTCYGYCGRASFGWTRASGGYLIHTCGRRVSWAPDMRKFLNSLLDRFGKNLLSPRLTRSEWRNPPGW